MPPLYTGEGKGLETGGSWTRPRPLAGSQKLCLAKRSALFFGLFVGLALFCCGCPTHTTYIEGSRKIIAVAPGSTVILPSGEHCVLADENSGGSKLWWVLTDKYLIEIFELLGRKKPDATDN